MTATTNFPSAYPGHPDGPDTALNAEIELALRENWDDPELRAHLSADGYVVPTELPDLTLPDAVDLMLRAYWKPDSKLHKSLETATFFAPLRLSAITRTLPTTSASRRSPSSPVASRPSWSGSAPSVTRRADEQGRYAAP